MVTWKESRPNSTEYTRWMNPLNT